MTVPSAPLTSDGEPLLFGTYAPAATNLAALFRAYQVAALNGENVGELGVYPTSGLPKTGYIVTTAGTAIAIAGSFPCQGVLVKADPDNTENLWVGPSSITADKTAGTAGFILLPGESIVVPCRNTNQVFVRRGGSVNQGAYYSASLDA